MGLPPTQKALPTAGEAAARETLTSFLTVRGVGYLGGISSPERAFYCSSWLSPYLAWGNLSVWQVYAASRRRRRELESWRCANRDLGRWERSLLAFENRLRWRDHFIQKLETRPCMEFQNLNRGFDGMRETAASAERFEAFAAGQTGYPLVDACVRALLAKGWLNFRMRAMLVSFACYHLWLDWRPVGQFLARHWVDLEPGIHWPQMQMQMQMQSGVTGLHTPRIYSPAKQARDHDPAGTFIRRWVPELEGLPTHYLAEPHTLPPLTQGMLGCVIGKDYPRPIVEPKAAYAEARRTLQSWRERPEVQQEVARIVSENGWVPSPAKRAKPSKPTVSNPQTYAPRAA